MTTGKDGGGGGCIGGGDERGYGTGLKGGGKGSCGS